MVTTDCRDVTAACVQVRVVCCDWLARLVRMRRGGHHDDSVESALDVHQNHSMRHTSDPVTSNCSPAEQASLTRDTPFTCSQVKSLRVKLNAQ